MKINFIRSSKKKKILKQLNLQFGITKIPHLLIETAKNKFRGYTGTLSKEEIAELNRITNIESIGLYLIKEEGELRLSIDATHLFKDQITKNIVEIDKPQFEKWIRGHDLNISATKRVKVIKYDDNFIGCGKSNEETIFNYVPKERRIKK